MAIRPHPTNPVSMDFLPPELLIGIFRWHALDEPLAPLGLRSVCRRWKDIADWEPTLWQRIYLDSSTTTVRNLNQIATLFLQKSQPLQVDVEVWAHDTDCILPILSPILPSVARWRTFSTTGFRTEHIDMSLLPTSSTTAPPLPLDRLVIHLHDYEFDELEDGEPGEDTPFAVTHPTFSSDGVMQLWVASLPVGDQINPLHFTHLTITEGVFEASQTSAASILGVLSACPSLRVFLFEGWLHEEEVASRSPYNTVMLPSLDVLKVRTTFMTRSILSSLSTPRLRVLSLTYLNVDSHIESADMYGDKGDSEDEANDFSQSPWSDHATGMGLRTLISRSWPPIRSLEMDYSDMRTKDFHWVFDRLDTLEDFRIVASDMSDNVINLLKPEPGNNGKMKLRLPRLNRLELSHCQRLTGEAIVRALAHRVIFTDTTDDIHLFSKLKRVCISGCDGLDARHEALLRSVLGPRFVS